MGAVPSSAASSTPLTSSVLGPSPASSLLHPQTPECATCGKKTRRDACTADDPTGQLGQSQGDGSVVSASPQQAAQPSVGAGVRAPDGYTVSGGVGGAVGIGVHEDIGIATDGTTSQTFHTVGVGLGVGDPGTGVTSCAVYISPTAPAGTTVYDVVGGMSYEGQGGIVSYAQNDSGSMVCVSTSTSVYGGISYTRFDPPAAPDAPVDLNAPWDGRD